MYFYTLYVQPKHINTLYTYKHYFKSKCIFTDDKWRGHEYMFVIYKIVQNEVYLAGQLKNKGTNHQQDDKY